MVYDWENIIYVSQDGTDHAILCLNRDFYVRDPVTFYNKKVTYANGYLFCQESNFVRNYMERIKIADIMEEILQAE